MAHRGLHDAQTGVIENTSSAFAAAIAGGYGIECDLQISADGEAMVYHDDTLGRLTDGNGRLDAMTAAELKRGPFKATADRMITLARIVRPGGRPGDAAHRIEKPVRRRSSPRRRAAKVLAGYAGPVAVMSFDPAQIAALRETAPQVPRGLVAESPHPLHRREQPPAAAKDALGMFAQCLARAPAVHRIFRRATCPHRCRRLARKVLGLPLLTWTVRSAISAARAGRYADQMIFEGFRP